MDVVDIKVMRRILCVFKEERIRNEIDATGINSTLNGQTAMVVMKRN